MEYHNFDWNKYINYYPDLKNDNINTKIKAWKHWIYHGKNEGRMYFDLSEEVKLVTSEVKEEVKHLTLVKPNYENFNWTVYVNYYNDLINDNVNTKEKAWKHWIKYGEREGRVYFDNIEYTNFDWKNYINKYDDLKKINTKEHSWEHWYCHGKKENRSLSPISTTTTITTTTQSTSYSYENSFFINLACHFLSLKYNIKFEYYHYELTCKFGIDLFIGKNTSSHQNSYILTNDNFFTLISDTNSVLDTKDKIVLSNDLHCITKDFCLFVKKHYEYNENKNKIVHSNLFKDRYVSNNDLYIYISINSINENYVDNMFDFYNENIKSLKYDNIYISSNDINHAVCQKLMTSYSMTIDSSNDICEKIMFANTCKYLILSSDVVSLIIGIFSFFSKHIYYPIILNSKYNEIFEFLNWKGCDVLKKRIKPTLSPPSQLKTSYIDVPSEEWYDSPFINPKTEKSIKNEQKKIKPKVKVQVEEEAS